MAWCWLVLGLVLVLMLVGVVTRYSLQLGTPMQMMNGALQRCTR